MRTIKFRGKRLDNREWIYGSLDLTGEQPTILWNKVDEDGVSAPWFANVDSETVCQFTGLRDINGKEIYEGDIVRISITPTCETAEANARNADLMGIKMPSWIDGGDIIARISYFDCAFHFIHISSYLPQCGENVQEPMLNYLFYERHPDVHQMYNQTIEVIGNTHDNPGLVKQDPNESE